MTKQELIQQAYGDSWNIVKDYVDENGYVDIVRNKIKLISFFNVSDLYFSPLPNLVRPKSLTGIEHNNGWIAYNNKNIISLPGDCLVFTDHNKIYSSTRYYQYSTINEFEKITHYKKIEMPEPPLY